MTEKEKKILQKLLEDKEKLIAIKKKYGKEYETLDKKNTEKIKRSN